MIGVVHQLHALECDLPNSYHVISERLPSKKTQSLQQKGGSGEVDKTINDTTLLLKNRRVFSVENMAVPLPSV